MKKKLRILVKITSILLLLLLVIYIGYKTFFSLQYKPYKVRVTNITDSSFAVSWITDYPMSGIIYYKDTDSLLPGPLSWVGAKRAFDDRDFVDAQSRCIEDFNAKIFEAVDTEFTVSTEGYNCDDLSVTRYGKYYVHHVTLRDLEDDKKYYFRVGNGYFSWDTSSGEYLDQEVIGIDNFEAQTEEAFSSVTMPSPAYGTVYKAYYNEEDILTESNNFDSLVFVRVFEGGSELGTFSAVSNSEGGWSIDLSNLRYEDGSLVSNIGELDLLFIPQVENSPPVFSRVFDYGEITFPLHLLGNEEGNWEKEVEGSSTKLEVFIDKIVGIGKASSECKTTDKLVSKSCEIGDCYYEKRIGSTGEICGYESAPEEETDCRPWYCMNVYSRPETDTNYIPVKDETTGEIVLTEITTENLEAGIALARELGLDKYTIDKIEEVHRVNSPPPSCGFVVDTYASTGVRYCRQTCNPENDDIFFDNRGDCNNWLSDPPPLACFIYNAESDKCDYRIQDTCDINNNEFENFRACKQAHPGQSEPSGDFYFDGTECVSISYQTGTGIYPTQTACELANPIIKGSCLVGYIKKQIRIGEKLFLKCVHESDYNIWLNECDGKHQSSDSIVRILDEPDTSDNILHMTLQCPQKNYTIGINITNGQIDPVRDGTYGCCRKHVGTTEIYIIQKGGDGCDHYYQNIENCGQSIQYEPFYCLHNETHKIIPYLFNPKEDGKDRCQGNSQKIDNNTNTIDGVNCCKTASSEVFIGSCASVNRVKWYKCVNVKSTQEVIINHLSNDSLEQFFNKIYAQEITYGEDDSFLYFPDSGVYDVELLNGESLSLFGDNKSNYFFYYDQDGVEGYQSAIDPSNPEANEDIIIHASSTLISITQVTSARQVTLNKGVNILSFDFLPSQREKEPLQAEELMNLVNRGEDRVSKISYFSGGSWNGGLVYDFETDIIRGNSFPLIFGKGYVLIAEMDTTVTIPGYEINASIPLAFSSGWNLIGVNGYTKTFTARTLIDSVNNVSGLTADNVTWWPTSKGMYEGLQVSESTEYGFDYPISTSNGYFVRISDFEPTDTTCKSLIWHPDGELHGQCGNN